MKDELLKGMCAQVANMAKTELRYRHCLNGILAVYFEGQGLHRLREIEKLAEKMCGNDWLNHGDAKDKIFGVLSFGAKIKPPDAIVVCTAINDYKTTAAFDALAEDEKERILDEGYPSRYPQYFTAHDALMALAQSPDRVCIFRQRLEGGLFIGEPEIINGPQSGFDGRLKLFGVEPPSEIAEAFAKMQAETGGMT